jgi:hypothetical protein
MLLFWVEVTTAVGVMFLRSSEATRLPPGTEKK